MNINCFARVAVAYLYGLMDQLVKLDRRRMRRRVNMRVCGRRNAKKKLCQ